MFQSLFTSLLWALEPTSGVLSEDILCAEGDRDLNWFKGKFSFDISTWLDYLQFSLLDPKYTLVIHSIFH